MAHLLSPEWHYKLDLIKEISWFEENWPCNTIEPSNPWHGLSLHLFRFSLISLTSFINFSVKVFYIFYKSISISYFDVIIKDMFLYF